MDELKLEELQRFLPDGFTIEADGKGYALYDPRGFFTHIPRNGFDCKRLSLAIAVYHMTRETMGEKHEQ